MSAISAPKDISLTGTGCGTNMDLMDFSNLLTFPDEIKRLFSIHTDTGPMAASQTFDESSNPAKELTDQKESARCPDKIFNIGGEVKKCVTIRTCYNCRNILQKRPCPELVKILHSGTKRDDDIRKNCKVDKARAFQTMNKKILHSILSLERNDS